jgi:cytochrome c-type biogenesis protein CcmE
VLVLAATLTFAGLRDSVVYFVAPSELTEKAEPGQRLRLGGLVVEGTVRRDADGAARFAVTDGATQVEVRYDGVLPDLFREGQGVVAEGTWRPGEAFEAERVLAKHDENYMPREVAEALKERGEWKGDAPP